MFQRFEIKMPLLYSFCNEDARPWVKKAYESLRRLHDFESDKILLTVNKVQKAFFIKVSSLYDGLVSLPLY